MKKYIDADKLIYETELMRKVADGITIDGIIEHLRETPAADVAEVVHGKWIDVPLNVYDDRYGMNKYNLRTKCSVCEYAMPREYPRFNICPCCGAKMDKE